LYSVSTQGWSRVLSGGRCGLGSGGWVIPAA
jgi:hypothetical protein